MGVIQSSLRGKQIKRNVVITDFAEKTSAVKPVVIVKKVRGRVGPGESCLEILQSPHVHPCLCFVTLHFIWIYFKFRCLVADTQNHLLSDLRSDETDSQALGRTAAAVALHLDSRQSGDVCILKKLEKYISLKRCWNGGTFVIPFLN